MPNENNLPRAEAIQSGAEKAPTKAELQRQMAETREALAETVEEIKETVTEQYTSVKETVTGVLDYREHFQKEPLVWSLGALSAGFALGYTLGYAHKEMKGSKRKQSPVAAFADSIAQELSTVGQSLVLPTLEVKIKELFGFDFSQLLSEMGAVHKSGAKKPVQKKSRPKSTKKKSGKRKTSRLRGARSA
jgi:hypothetical protein